ncbi:hypothetical protein D0Z67_12315 [Streptomyces seoulensis]|uniref:Uncharacterized protein n=1 Tax=Streptomyces seoulensis TaxID=73044 RepID=A0A4P6TUJ5_STRSO|nr:hypothetical protein [Streptomyces seoulensis]QBJ91010.1 hypothetical protein D0Z67_12315 [Streptomyces seoulensis]
MSLIEGLDASADWVAKDMEALLRECDALIASKNTHLTRLAAGVKALQAEIEQTSSERDLVVADREKAEQVLRAFQAAVQEGKGLRQSRGRGQTRLHLVPDVLPSPGNGAEGADAAAPLAAPAPAPAPAPQPPTPVEPESNAVIRIHGERSIAVMRIITTEPDRHWTPKDVAVRLEGPEKDEDQGAHSRARALLDSLARRRVLNKRRDGGDRRCVFQLAAAWEAA